MTLPHLPPLLPLQAFEAAARLGSFKGAAAELHLTPSAISHRVKALERFLGLALFQRLNREVRLTAEGRAYAAAIRQAFDAVAQASGRVRRPAGQRELHISAVPFFAATWIIPHLEEFLARQPGLRLFVESTTRNADFGRDRVDAAIRWGHGRWAGLVATRLADIGVAPVAAPALLVSGARAKRLRIQDLRQHTMIHLTYAADAWPRWLALAGAEGLKPRREIWVDSLQQSLDAAARGLGVALGPLPLIAPSLAEGRLHLPFVPVLHDWQPYWLVCRRRDAEKPELRALRDWLLDLMQRARSQMSQIHPKAAL